MALILIINNKLCALCLFSHNKVSYDSILSSISLKFITNDKSIDKFTWNPRHQGYNGNEQMYVSLLIKML